jgi:hypothetical protein
VGSFIQTCWSIQVWLCLKLFSQRMQTPALQVDARLDISYSATHRF